MERATPRLRARLGTREACFSGVFETGDSQARFRDFLDFRGVDWRESEELIAYREIQGKQEEVEQEEGVGGRRSGNEGRFEAD